MQKLLVSALALSMMAGPAVFAQTTAPEAPPQDTPTQTAQPQDTAPQTPDAQPQDTQTAPAPLKNIKGTVKVDGDKAAFVSDSDQKSWEVMNPEAVKDHDGHHVQVSAHVYADKDAIQVMSVKMLKAK